MTKPEAFSLEFLEPAAPVVVPGPVFTYSTPEQSWARRRLIRLVERLSGRARFERIYRDWQDRRDEGETVFTSAIRALGVRVEVSALDMARIPATGPVLERDEFSWNHDHRKSRSSRGERQRFPIPLKLIPL